METIELKAGALRCELAPALGGSIAGLWLGDVPVLRSTPAAQLESGRLAGCYPIVPFSNRIGHATVVWQGTQQPQIRHDGDEPHAIHGAGWQRPWTVLECDAASAMLSFEHRPDAAWPFAFDCSHTLRLRPGRLELTLALTNQSPQAAPAGLGWHPSFVKRPGSHMAFKATGRWQLGANRLPAARQPTTGVYEDCTALDLDGCYDGWDGIATLADERLQVRIESDLTRLVAFTRGDGDTLAIEPVSHIANAVHLYATGASAAHLGLQVLQPGESLIAQMAIAVEARL